MNVHRTLALFCALGLTAALTLVAPASSSAQERVRRLVTDLAQALSPAEVERLAAQVAALNAERGVELAVLVLLSTEPEPIDDFAQRQFELAGLGQAGVDNGALLMVALHDRRARLHLGYGLEGWIADSRAADLLARGQADLGEGRVADGLAVIVAGIGDALRDYAPGASPPVSLSWSGGPWLWLLTILASVALAASLLLTSGRLQSRLLVLAFFGVPATLVLLQLLGVFGATDAKHEVTGYDLLLIYVFHGAVGGAVGLLLWRRAFLLTGFIAALYGTHVGYLAVHWSREYLSDNGVVVAVAPALAIIALGYFAGALVSAPGKVRAASAKKKKDPRRRAGAAPATSDAATSVSSAAASPSANTEVGDGGGRSGGGGASSSF